MYFADFETYQLFRNLNEIIKITHFQKGDPVITVGTEPISLFDRRTQYGDVIFDDVNFSERV
jgi:hypothetical protein